MKTCAWCKKDYDLSCFDVNPLAKDRKDHRCKNCKKISNDITNKNTMYVNGKYVKKSDPRYRHIWKPGKYESWIEVMSADDIKKKVSDGDIYVIHNAAWNSWYKVGKALDATDRLKGYQTSSPFRDYELLYFKFYEDYSTAESDIHTLIEQHPQCRERRNEWFYTDLDVIKQIMQEYGNEEVSPRHRDEHHPQYDLGLCNP